MREVISSEIYLKFNKHLSEVELKNVHEYQNILVFGLSLFCCSDKHLSCMN